MGGQLTSHEVSCCGFLSAGRSPRSKSGSSFSRMPPSPQKEGTTGIDEPLVPSAVPPAAASPQVKKTSRWNLRRLCSCCKRRADTGKARLEAFGRDSDGATSPTLDALDEEKRRLLAEMRRRLLGLPPSEAVPSRHDLWLKRFLAHKKWNLDKAMEAYLAMEAWRCEVRADKILAEAPDGPLENGIGTHVDMAGFYSYSFDRTGRIVIWMRVGHVPWWRSLFERTEHALQSQLWHGEWLSEQVAQRAKKTGVWRERSVVLVDLSHLDFAYFQGLSGSGRARRRGAAQSTAEYYPGVVDKAYILNAPGFANKAWSILKYFLSEKLMEKAELVGSQAEVAAMLQDLGAENVPRALGGESDRPSMQLPRCLMMPANGWNEVIEAWQPSEISIKGGGTHEEIVRAPAGTCVRWQWALLSSAVHFEVTCSRKHGGVDTIAEKEEFEFNDMEDPIYGEASAPSEGGEFRFVWDNSSSRMWSKTLVLRLELVGQ